MKYHSLTERILDILEDVGCDNEVLTGRYIDEIIVSFVESLYKSNREYMLEIMEELRELKNNS